MAQYSDFVSVLFQSRTQTHIWHLQTDSHAEHSALGDYYESIVDLTDALIEGLQGCYPRITGYTTKPLADWKQGQSLDYMRMIDEYITTNRTSMPSESWIQNSIDEIQQLVGRTIYKLTQH